MASVSITIKEGEDCYLCDPRRPKRPHIHVAEIPKCPDCGEDLRHTSTKPPKSIYSCMNVNCVNQQHYYLSGTPLVTSGRR